jgi:hypothetical protein
MTRDIAIDALRTAWFKRHSGEEPACCSTAIEARKVNSIGCRNISTKEMLYHQLNESRRQLLG